MARPHARTIRILFATACLVVTLWGIRESTGVLNPVLIAGFLTLLTQPILNRLRRFGPVAALVVLLFVLAVGLAGIGLLGASVAQIIEAIPTYRAQIDQLTVSIARALPSGGANVSRAIESALRDPQLTRIALAISGDLVTFVGNLGISLFIFVFMMGSLWEMERRAGKDAHDHSDLAERFMAFATTIRRYMGVRALLGLGAATLNFLLFQLLDVDHAGLWALLSFLTSFIPSIGFFIALVPPVVIALLANGWVNALFVLIGFVAINSMVDNVIGPRIVGKQMEISPLLTFISVIFWAWVLGPIGAILAIPLTLLVKDFVGEGN